MTYSLYLQLIGAFSQLAVGQDTVPGSTGRPPTPGTTTTDRFVTPQGDPLLDELGKAFGSVPSEVRRTLEQLRAHHLTDRIWFYLGDEGNSHGDSIHLLPDNRILRLAPLPGDLRLYTYNPTTRTWTEIGSRTNDPTNPHTNPQIAAGIRAILASRTERNWISPSIRTRLNNLNVTQHADGTLQVRLSNGQTIRLSFSTSGEQITARIIQGNPNLIFRNLNQNEHIAFQSLISNCNLQIKVGDSFHTVQANTTNHTTHNMPESYRGRVMRTSRNPNGLDSTIGVRINNPTYNISELQYRYQNNGAAPVTMGTYAVLGSGADRSFHEMSSNGIRNLANLRATPYSNSTWNYRGYSLYGRHDSIVVHPETGFIVCLTHGNYDLPTGEVHVYNGNNYDHGRGFLEDRQSFIGSYRIGQNGEITFNPNENRSKYNQFNQMPTSFVVNAINSIVQSRRNRNWRPPNQSNLGTEIRITE